MSDTKTLREKKTNAKAIREKGEFHGEEGHFNVVLRDQDSCVTGYGEHARVMACLPDSEGLYARIDMKWGLLKPTPEQILTVAREDQGIKGKWIFDREEEYESYGITRFDVYFKLK
jgi:hypothetical protein